MECAAITKKLKNKQEINDTISRKYQQIDKENQNLTLDGRINSMPKELKYIILSNVLVKSLPNKKISWLVRGRMARAIEKLGDKTDVPALREMLSNQEINWFVRCSIGLAIVELSDKNILTALREMLPNVEIGHRTYNAINNVKNYFRFLFLGW